MAAGNELPTFELTVTCNATESVAACGGVTHFICPYVTVIILQASPPMVTVVSFGDGSNPFPLMVTVNPPFMLLSSGDIEVTFGSTTRVSDKPVSNRAFPLPSTLIVIL